FASSANRCCFVDTGLEFRCIRRLSLQRCHDPTPRFPPRGPGGSRVHASTVLSRRYDFLPSLPPRFVAFAGRYHTMRYVHRLHRAKRNQGGPGVLRVRQPPTPTYARRRQDLPSSRETPIAYSPCSSTPAGLHAPHRDGAAARPPLREPRRLLHWDFRSSIARLLGWLSTLRGASCPTATQDSLPGAGWAFLDGLAYPQGFAERFPSCSYISFPLPELTWRNPCYLFLQLFDLRFLLVEFLDIALVRGGVLRHAFQVCPQAHLVFRECFEPIL